MVDLYLDIIAWFPNNGLIVVEQTFVGERVILAEGEFSIQQEPRNTGGTYARLPNKNQEIQGEPMPDFQTRTKKYRGNLCPISKLRSHRSQWTMDKTKSADNENNNP